MKRLFIPVLLLILVSPLAFAKEDPLLARVTVYWASGGAGSDHNTRLHRCATGARLRNGHCAVDPRHIPYGSRVVLPNGETLAAVDTGTAVRTRKAARKAGRTVSEKNALVVDRFFETKRQALAWANSHPLFMPIKVVKPGMAKAGPETKQETTVMAIVSPKPNDKPMLASNANPGRSALNRMGRSERF